jgi:hypothetical protein
MLRWSNRSYFARYTVILITSRDFAILLLYRCLRHSHTEHELRAIFFHLNFLKNDRKSQIALFWKNFLQTKIFFLTHLLYAKSTVNSDRKLYKKKWCDQMRIWSSFHWTIDSLFNFTNDCREDVDKLLLPRKKRENVDKLSQIVDTKNLLNFHRLLSRSVLLKK